jgi:hypothetical protein
MTKINFTLEQLRLIVNQMELIEYSGINQSSLEYKRALQIKNKIIKQYHKQK